MADILSSSFDEHIPTFHQTSRSEGQRAFPRRPHTHFPAKRSSKQTMSSRKTTREEEPSYQIRPNFEHKFRPGAVRELIHGILNEVLAGKSYEGDQVASWCEEISDGIKEQIKTLGYDRYKIVVEVVLGEQRGEGVRMGTRCLWDSDTDNYASDVFMNDSLFCCAAAFGIFYY